MPRRLAVTVSTESVSVSIAKAFEFLIFFIQSSRSFLLRTVLYLPSFFGDFSSLLLFIAANSNSLKIFSSSSSSGLKINKSSNLRFRSTSSLRLTNSIFLSRSFKLFLRLSPTTPLIESALLIIPFRLPYSFNHLAAVF